MSMMKQSTALEQQIARLEPKFGPDSSVIRDFKRQLVSLKKAEERVERNRRGGAPDQSETESIHAGTRNGSASPDPMQPAIDASEASLREMAKNRKR